MIYVNFAKRFIIALLFGVICVFEVDASRPDSLMSNYKVYPLPILSFNSDVGLNYGGLVYLYYYGKHRRFFPNYKTRLYTELSSSVKGTQVARLQVDYKEVLKNFRGIVDVGFYRDAALPFFGFDDVIAGRDRSLSYYRAFRSLTYAKMGGFLKLYGEQFKLFGSVSLYRIIMDDVRQTDAELLFGKDSTVRTLFEDFRRWGILTDRDVERERIRVAISSGLVFNSLRPVDFSPYGGTRVEVLGRWVPGQKNSRQNNQGYFRLYATLKQFVGIVPRRVVWAYRVFGSKVLWGNVPVVEKPFYFTSQNWYDAVGGINTLRGVFRDRLVADNFVVGNTELRFFVMRFNLFSSLVDLVLYPYLDAGRLFVPKNHGYITLVPQQRRREFESGYANAWTFTYGGGAAFVVDYNFVANISFGVPNHKDMGDRGIFLGLNFMF